MKNIAVFISGAGSNALRMLDYFSEHEQVRVRCLVSSKANEAVSEVCNKMNVKYIESTFSELDYEHILHQLEEYAVEWVVLAGFLKKIPPFVLRRFPNKIINLHPSLLPKYGGKGMYGMNVHRAVIKAKEKESGITIHYVNEQYDKGKVIEQITIPVHPSYDANELFERIRKLEAEHFPRIIEKEVIKEE